MDKKTTIYIGAMIPDLERMKMIRGKLPKNVREDFTSHYGNIMDLLRINGQVGAIFAFTQFYDPPLRCFTFQDFQLAPTLEEFEQVLGFSKIKEGPYTEIGRVIEVEDLSKAWGIPLEGLRLHYKEEVKVRGIKREYLESKALSLADKGEWEPCRDIFALLIFGVILFPNVMSFIDSDAVGIFWSVKVLGKDPTHALLANIYYVLHVQHGRGEGVLQCCIPLLYSWLLSHLGKQRYMIKNLTKEEWLQKSKALTIESIVWCPNRLEIKEVIFNCGDFPNVPLIETQAFINYNPTLALRQLGYPWENAPSDGQLQQLILHDMG
ncbi:uncharacterized protein LOC131637048 [Vicia villosa]|uniref:uncharacterized protein LOC131637048 n=1 Tax=Vicia villosa TaxID=3911 RepID=UPI00273C000D|nr:uncharacterized protein LOC131637048 [Vicia villosa]